MEAHNIANHQDNFKQFFTWILAIFGFSTAYGGMNPTQIDIDFATGLFLKFVSIVSFILLIIINSKKAYLQVVEWINFFKSIKEKRKKSK